MRKNTKVLPVKTNARKPLSLKTVLLPGCRVYGFLGSVAALAEIWSLTAIAIDRLKAIYHPLEKNKRLNKKDVSDEIRRLPFLNRDL